MKRIIFIFLLFPFALNLTGQNKDKAIFREQKPGFYQKYILPDDRIVKESKDLSIPGKSFAVDLSSVSLPNRIELYREKQWHNSPVSQGATGTCWSFSTTSMLESEVYRLSKMKVKLSEIHTVYWEYVEKPEDLSGNVVIQHLKKDQKLMPLPVSGKNTGLSLMTAIPD
jgi:bleomycin hydrolase